MKRIVLWISLLVCILSLGALSNSVSASPDTLTVTVQVPEDWNDVHLFAWKEDFDILSAWPGTPMSEGSDGRYTLEIPSGYPYVIVNNGEGGAQTQDMEMDGISNIWVVISDYYGEVFTSTPALSKSTIPLIL